MTLKRWTLAAACGLWLAACGPQHTARPTVDVGQMLDLTVDVPDPRAAQAEGSVYYRMPGEPAYRAFPLAHRRDALVFAVPTDHLAPGETIEYYFDVFVDGQLKPLGSPDEPYTTRVVRAAGAAGGPGPLAVAGKPTIELVHGGADAPIIFYLHKNGLRIDRAELTYHAPQIPGRVVADMEPWSGSHRLVIPAYAVAPGEWRYRIRAICRDRILELPPEGDAAFEIE